MSLLVLGACSDELEVKPLYNPANGRVVVEVNEDISDKQLYVSVRRGNFGALDGKKSLESLTKIATRRARASTVRSSSPR